MKSMAHKTVLVFSLAVCFVIIVAEAESAGRPDRELSVTMSAGFDRGGVIKAGDSETSYTFWVDQAGEIILTIVSPIQLMAALLAPDGTVIDKTTAASSGMEIFTYQLEEGSGLLGGMGLGIGEHISFVGEAPGVGRYKLRLQSAQTLEKDTPFLVAMRMTSDIQVALIVLSEEVEQGQPVVLAALVFEGISPALNSVVRVVAADASNNPLELTLVDDGTGGDLQAKDGIFTGVIIPETAGDYVAAADIVGINSTGQAFQRTASTSFRVYEKDMWFTGVYSAQPVDEDDDGSYEHIDFSTGVESKRSVTAELTAIITSPRGSVAATNWIGSVENGSSTLTLSLGTEDILELGVDGPYTVTQLDIYELTEENQLLQDRVYDPYVISGVGWNNMEITGKDVLLRAISMGVQDDDGDGLFEGIVADFDVDVLREGNYRWSACLRGTNGKDIDCQQQADSLVRGEQMVSLVFEGCQVGRSMEAGPLNLQDLLFERGDVPVFSRLNAARISYLLHQFPCREDKTPPRTDETVAGNVNEAGAYESDIRLTLLAEDEPGGSGVREIHYEMSGAQEGKGYADNDTTRLVISARGETTLKYYAVDHAGNSEESHQLVLTIAESNHQPVFDDIKDRRVSEGATVEFSVNAVDVDGDALSYSANNLPPGASFDPVSRMFSYTPGYGISSANEDKKHTVVFAAEDSRGALDQIEVTLSITNVNRPPVANASAEQQMGCTTENEARVTLKGSASTDPDGDQLNFNWTGSFGNLTGESVNVTLPEGTHMVTLTVDDGNDGTNSDTVEVTVICTDGDLDGDSDVDSDDFNAFRAALGKCNGTEGYNQVADYDGDGCVSYRDFRIWLGYYRNQ